MGKTIGWIGVRWRMYGQVASVLLCAIAGSGFAFPPTFTEQTRLRPPDVVTGDNFGTGLAIHGDTIVIGARYDVAPTFIDEGSAYVFDWSGAGWNQTQKLIPSTPVIGDLFGTAIALTDTFLVVGAPGRDGSGGTNQGGVYVFEKIGLTWNEQAMLFASDAAPQNGFGSSAAISGTTLIVGAPAANAAAGSVYVFVHTGLTWTQQAELTALDATAGDNFGRAIDLDGEMAIVGAPKSDAPGSSNRGAAYVFERVEGVWIQSAKLVPQDVAAGDEFGTSVSIDGIRAVVGSPFDDINADSNRGSAYVFELSGPLWLQHAKLTASDGTAFDNFGSAVGLGGLSLVVGASGYDGLGGVNQGSAYVFLRAATGWSEQFQLIASDAGPADLIGHVAAMEATSIVLGTYGDAMVDGANAAYAYRFDCLAAADCPDLGVCSCDRCVDAHCEHMASAFGDIDCSGLIELGDVLCVLQGYSDVGLCPEGDLAPNCTGDDPPLIELSDVLSILAAYGGVDPCGCGR